MSRRTQAPRPGLGPASGRIAPGQGALASDSRDAGRSALHRGGLSAPGASRRPCSNRGGRCRQVATRLCVPGRTLRRWRRLEDACRPARPALQGVAASGAASGARLARRPGLPLGAAALRAAFPGMPRCELQELQRQWHAAYRVTHHRAFSLSNLPFQICDFKSAVCPLPSDVCCPLSSVPSRPHGHLGPFTGRSLASTRPDHHRRARRVHRRPRQHRQKIRDVTNDFRPDNLNHVRRLQRRALRQRCSTSASSPSPRGQLLYHLNSKKRPRFRRGYRKGLCTHDTTLLLKPRMQERGDDVGVVRRAA